MVLNSCDTHRTWLSRMAKKLEISRNLLSRFWEKTAKFFSRKSFW